MMSNSNEMVVCLFLLPSILFLAQHGAGLDQECTTSTCGIQGPPVRFPFRIKGRQPPHCSYPEVGFDLWCSEKNHTVMELPNSWKPLVQTIDYKSQVIYASDFDGVCLPKRLLLSSNLSDIYPFSLMDCIFSFTLFNCSSKKGHSLQPITCLSSLHHYVYAITSQSSIQDLVLLLSCSKLQNISVGSEYSLDSQENVLQFSWYYPECSYCEEKGKYCRLKRSETECYGIIKPAKGSATKFITTGAVLGSIFLVVAVILLYRRYRFKRTEREYQSKIEKFLEDYKAFKPTRYSYADIKRMTNKFKVELGQGAYGTVFRGKLSNEILVAVKVLNNSEGNGEEFVNEVEAIGKIHHVNVIRLIGFCADGFIRALVYEYLPNSLQKFISSADSKRHFLGWKRLQDIVLGIAKGIEYLHQGCERRILHFDIKPHNILLDHDFAPKISDFGLSKFCSKDQIVVSIKTTRGTAGYMAPELFSRNFQNVSYKSDVYSFGIVVLEMVGGRKIARVTEVNDEQIYFPKWIYNLLERGEDLKFEIEEEGDTKIAKKLAIVGLQCIQWNPADRPSMNVVVHILEGEGDNLPIPPNPFWSAVPARMNSKKISKTASSRVGCHIRNRVIRNRCHQ